jgi:hypothetical protein
MDPEPPERLSLAELIVEERRRQSLSLADVAALVRKSAEDEVQAVAVLQEARGLALARDETACRRKLDEAQELASIGQRSSADGPGRHCTVEFVELQRASCLMELGRARSAIESFERGLARLPTIHRRDRGVYLSRLAVAHAIGGDPEAASATGLQAAQIAHATGSERIGTELYRLRSSLTPWRDHPSVARLSRALAMPA